MVIRKAECGLNEVLVDNGSDFISDKIENWKSVYELENSKSFLAGKEKVLSIAMWRNKDFYIYTQYKDRNTLLSARPNTIIYRDNEVYDFGDKVVYLVFDKNSKNLLHVDVMGNGEGKVANVIELGFFPSLKYNKVNLRGVGLYSVSPERASLYDKLHNATKMYLVKNDIVSLLDMTEDNFWCGIRYKTVLDKNIDAWLRCKDIHQ